MELYLYKLIDDIHLQKCVQVVEISKKDLKFSDRVYRCTCGQEIDRDLNAFINLAQYELVV